MIITVLYGGQSAEHEVSILSAFNIIKALVLSGYKVQPIQIKKDGKWLKAPKVDKALINVHQLELQNAQVATWALDETGDSTGVEISPGDIKHLGDVVFPILHGPNGEDGTVQGFFETLNIPYVGAGVTASATGMDKIISKQIFGQMDIPQVPYVAFNQREWKLDQEAWVVKCEGSLLYPLFVKPANMGSSVGISKVENTEALIKAIDLALKFDDRIVVEQGISAQEVEVAILGNEAPTASVVGRLIKEAEFYDYDEKYINNNVEMEIPADLPEEVTEKIRDYALRAFRAIDGSGLSRVDFFVTGGHDIYINEINTMPGFTPYSMYPNLWLESGLEYRQLVEALIRFAIERYEHKQKYLRDK